MKLLRVSVNQLRQFRDPVEIRDLEDGINLFTGPNESGKSTLVRAIRAAFFERHKSSSVGDLQPWGDSAAAPEVELQFEWQGKIWKVVKSFLKKKRCDVSVDGTTYSGDEGDDKLADLLGFDLPKKGASNEKHWGIPGLLWIEQGAGQEIKAPVEHAGQQLKAALGEDLGEVASSTGDELIGRVSSERSKLLTGRGKPTGELSKAMDQEEELQAELHDLRERIQRYADQVDRLGQLRAEQQKADAERPWEQFRQQAQQAQQALDSVTALQKDQERDQQALSDCQASIETTRELLKGFESQKGELAERERQQQEANQKRTELEARKPAVEEALEKARRAHKGAREALKRAENAERREELERQQKDLEADLKRDSDKLERAKSLHARLLESRQKQQALALDADSMKQLQEAVRALERLDIQQKAVATRLQYDLQDDQAVTLDGEALSGKGESLLLEPGEVAVRGVGTLRILPGGDDVAEVARNQARLTDERDGLLQSLGVSSLAEAEQRLAEHDELAQAIEKDQSVLNELAPEGLDALSDDLKLRQDKLERLAEQVSALPAPQGEALSVTRAQAQVETAEEALESAEDAYQSYKNEMALADQALEKASQEHRRIKTALEDPKRSEQEKQAQNQLLERGAAERRFQQSIAERDLKIQAARPDALQQDVERFTRSAEAAERQLEERTRELDKIQAVLETVGAEGLGEKCAETEVQLERASRRRAELQRRADALDLLLERLTAHRLELTRRLQAPLQKHLTHYVQLLFPGGSLRVDENLIPEVLVRQTHGAEERGSFDDLSFGAREQMALISRLAYADLLSESGQPTLIILDDALVHSDAERLKAMKRVLYDASQRHQILLFTCHPENWQDLGVVAQSMEALKSA
ncbi:MAG: hypothetical protein P1U64_11750 [Alcanivoracaceae bacterium]|nr:hypothetical protein [Alcanivoracaceae bacterium]